MKKLQFIITILAFLAFNTQVKAQNSNLPRNAKPGICYERCFEYDKKIEWKEVKCSKVKQEKSKKELVKCEQDKIKMKKYQEKLKSLGYDVQVTGRINNKTVNAHHQYLKKQKKAAKRKRKLERKQQRKLRK
ncbi:hypothetical protein PG913_01685 [Tenacibaculum pacificus]|uniref:hypothetical protein n=1 Tax=Tenacibaculum pacificus TaxID=3018314 RepID=UPI0022F3E9D5|nr:hypothetical protein [Tenacibaculum pacificus]WBX73981.1 hypothetical protein PG913_01685 [Tenacibaculum pacificus]